MWQSHVPLQPSSIALKGTKKAGRCNRMHLPVSFVLPDFLPSYWLEFLPPVKSSSYMLPFTAIEALPVNVLL